MLLRVHWVVSVVHVIWRSVLARRRLLLVFLHPSFVLAPAADEEYCNADQQENPKREAYRYADYGTSG